MHPYNDAPHIPRRARNPKISQTLNPPFSLPIALRRQLAEASQTLCFFKGRRIEFFGHPVPFMKARFPVRQLRPVPGGPSFLSGKKTSLAKPREQLEWRGKYRRAVEYPRLMAAMHAVLSSLPTSLTGRFKVASSWAKIGITSRLRPESLAPTRLQVSESAVDPLVCPAFFVE